MSQISDIRYSVRMAVAMHCGYDEQDLADYRYQASRTPCEVYSDPHGDADYFTATRGNRKPKASDNHYQGYWVWERVPSPHLPIGWNIWRRVDREDAP